MSDTPERPFKMKFHVHFVPTPGTVFGVATDRNGRTFTKEYHVT